MFWIAAACDVSSEPPLSVARRSMLPQRSNRCMPTNSSRSRSVTGDVNSTCSWRRRGKRRSLAASGARWLIVVKPFDAAAAPMNVGQLHHWSIFCSAAILILGVACHVIRRLFCCTLPLFSAGLLVSATYVHWLGLYALVLAKSPAYAAVRLKRVENQNHALSFLIGPPIDSFKSHELSILVGVGRPAFCSADV